MVATSLNGKIALVTGGGQGLGKQIATQLVAQGAKVAIVGRTLKALENVADSLGEAVLPIVADVGDPNQVRAAFNTIDDKLGCLDILINNAAVYTPFLIENAEDDELQHIINTNFLGAAYCIREAVKRMKPMGCGDIVNITSESVRNPFPYLTVYAASKSALETLTQGLRTELGSFGIRLIAFRSGTMRGAEASTSIANWSEEQLAEAFSMWQRTGHALYSGSGMDPATVAGALVHTLLLPREATVDLIELRSSR
jgi:NAD(P)-dependent dehydrogenase (short-subunit alcohol dehydrogenase family)